MTRKAAKQHGLWDAPASHSPQESRLERILEQVFFTHPVITMTLSLVAVGAGMLLVVSAFTLLLAIPLGLLYAKFFMRMVFLHETVRKILQMKRKDLWDETHEEVAHR